MGKQGFKQYVKDFSLMASKGLFSFNTDLVHGSQGHYYLLVTIPEKSLHASETPVNIRGLVYRTVASLRLSSSPYINAHTTEAW